MLKSLIFLSLIASPAAFAVNDLDALKCGVSTSHDPYLALIKLAFHEKVLTLEDLLNLATSKDFLDVITGLESTPKNRAYLNAMPGIRARAIARWPETRQGLEQFLESEQSPKRSARPRGRTRREFSYRIPF